MKKPVYLLFGILVIFVIIYFLLVQKERKTFSPGRVENFLQLDSADVERIEFRKFESKLVLHKENQRWYMVEPDSHRADNNAVGRLLSAASRLEVGEIISSNPEKRFWFQVDSLTGTGLDFFSGESRLASLVMGKISDDRMHGYIRKTGSDDVYLAEVGFVRMAQRSVNEWRDRRIFTFESDQVKEIEFAHDKEKFKLFREDTLWRLSRYPYEQTIAADAGAAETYVQTLANIRADDFPFKSQIQGLPLEAGQPIIKLTFRDDREEKLFAVPSMTQEEKRFFVKTDQDRSVFTLLEYNYKRLTKSLEDFQPKEES